jgi:hypothetical protein
MAAIKNIDTVNDSLELLLIEMEKNSENKIPFTTSFNHDIGIALIKYTKDTGANKCQDIIRLAVSSLLKKAGYIKEL